MFPQGKDTIPLVRCEKHPGEYITNYDCIKMVPICPECLDDHLKSNQQQGIPPEVDTLKKVRNMCSSKSIALADSLEKELMKIGLDVGGDVTSLFIKFEADIEKIRRQLHHIVDDYLESVKRDLHRKLKGDHSDSMGMSKLLDEIRQMITELRKNEKQLYGNQILSAIKKIIYVNQDSYIEQIKRKLSMLYSEKETIDLTLDEDEMVDLLNVLQRIVSANKKTVSNANKIDRLMEQPMDARSALDGNITNYFSKKFYTQTNSQTNEMSLKKISDIRKVQLGINPVHSAYDNSQHGVNIRMRDFFSQNNMRKEIAHYAAKTKEICLFSLENIELPQLMDRRRVTSQDLHISAKTGVFHMPDGFLYFTGGFSDQFNGAARPHNFCYRYNLVSRQFEQVCDLVVPRASHGICSMNSVLYVCGGVGDNNALLNSFEKYDPVYNTWARLPNCPTATKFSLLIAFKDRYILKIGGLNNTGEVPIAFERYDISTNQWESLKASCADEPEYMKNISFGYLPLMTGCQINYNTILIIGGIKASKTASRQSFILTQSDDGLKLTISNINKVQLDRDLSFSHSQCLIYQNHLIALSDKVDTEDNSWDVGNISGRELVVFDGKNWHYA